jgi:hypothetical protein
VSDDADAVARAERANSPPSPSTDKKRWEVVVVVILGLTALATAWSGYQASLWDGIQSSKYTQASAARTSAAQQRSAANQFRIADLTVFENHIDALISGNGEVADFYRLRFRDEFAVAYQAWLALDPLENQDAPSAPLEMPEYQLAADQTALDLEARADALFAEGEDANDYSDTYTLTTLLFAVVLFFAAIAERFEYVRSRVALLILAGIGLVSGVAVALGQPITGG